MNKQLLAFKKDSFALSDIRQNGTKKFLAAILAIVLSFVAALLITCLINMNINLFWQIPWNIITNCFNGISSINTTFSSMAILIVSSLAFLVAFKAGLFNMGISGQMIAGATIATIFAQTIDLPNGVGQIVILLISGAVGMLIGGLIGAMKAYLNVNEVVSSIIFNWIIYYLSTFMLSAILIGQSGDFTSQISANYGLTIDGNSFIPLIIISIILAVVTFVYLKYTIMGKKISSVGLSKTGAKAAGYNVEGEIIISMLISGLIAGILGVMVYCGKTMQMPLTNSGKAIPLEGFNGISVGLISMCAPLATIPVSLFFATIQGSATSIQILGVDPNMANVVFGIVVYGAAIITVFMMLKPYYWTIWLFKGKQYTKLIKDKRLDITSLNDYVNDCNILFKRYYKLAKVITKNEASNDFSLSQKTHMLFARIRYEIYRKWLLMIVVFKKVILKQNNVTFTNNIYLVNLIHIKTGQYDHEVKVLKNTIDHRAFSETQKKLSQFSVLKIDDKKQLEQYLTILANNYAIAKQNIIDHYKLIMKNQNNLVDKKHKTVNLDEIFNQYQLNVTNDISKTIINTKVFDNKLLVKQMHNENITTKKIELRTANQIKTDKLAKGDK